MAGMRQRPLRAFHLSTPYRRKVTRLMPTADLLALEKALVLGVFLLLAPKLHGAFPRLVLLRFRLRLGLQVLLNDAEVFEVGEFHEGKITKRMLIFVE